MAPHLHNSPKYTLFHPISKSIPSLKKSHNHLLRNYSQRRFSQNHIPFRKEISSIDINQNICNLSIGENYLLCLISKKR